MPKFLNTELISHWLLRLISTAKREIVIVVPYIQLSVEVYEQLLLADARGVETVIIFRENKLNTAQREKLDKIENVNLFQHPNIHCKSYYNGELLIIGSMNLYDYSEKNNREMGVLFARTSNSSYGNYNPDDKEVFNDFLSELQSIQNGSSLLKPSRETTEEGFEIEIMKTDFDKTRDLCSLMGKSFGHKKFEPIQYGPTWLPGCKNYFDKIDVLIEPNRRAIIFIKHTPDRVLSIYNHLSPSISETLFQGFKFYWNFHGSGIYLYPNSKDPKWHEINQEQELREFHKGLDLVVAWLRKAV